MSEDEVIVSQTGDKYKGSCCRVRGSEICMEYWGPNGHTATKYRIDPADLQDATRDRIMVSILGHDVVSWDGSVSGAWVPVAPTQPCEVPLFALYQIFGETLPPHLRDSPVGSTP